MKRTRATHAIVLSTALLIGAGPYVVRAAGVGQGQGPSIIANVDMARLVAESDAKRAASQKVQEFARKVADRFDETAALQYLTMAEIEEYSQAVNAEQPTAAQTQRIAALKTESAARTEEVRTLSAKPEAGLTATDRARLRTLTTSEQQRPAALDGLKRIYQTLVQQEDARQTREAAAQVREVVKGLAKELHVTEVFDASALVVAQIDLTTQALQRVKKK